MTYRDDILDEMGYVICPLCFPEYTYCNEKCEECSINIEFEKLLKENKGDKNV